MSIWTDCEEHEGAVPFFGFPVIPSFDGKILTLDFPKGYIPDGSQTKRIGDKFIKKYGGKLIKFDKKTVKIEVDLNEIAYILIGIKNGWYRFPFNYDPTWQEEECKEFSTEKDESKVREESTLAELFSMLKP